MSVVTRFAPSPTGMLHIGGARTALFNLLYARHHKGRFLLRIEDTDRKRSTPEATQAILNGLDWLGIKPDDAPVYQFANAARHVECAEQMIAEGKAFRCYATPEELQARRDAGDAARKAAKAEGISDDERVKQLAIANENLAAYRSPWRVPETPARTDTPFTVRLRAPDSGEIAIEDSVQGNVRVDATEIDDLILLRADGTPTYMLSVVVDDHDMGVTHIIRGDDHLRNALRQTPIYTAMGWDIPTFAHIPLIHGADGAKLSKRHGALGTLAYRDMGYLPEAVCNYLMRLGWSHGDKEIFSLEEASAVFGLDAIGKGPSRIDFEKLSAINGHYIREIDHDRLLHDLTAELSKTSPISPEIHEKVARALPFMRDRGDTLPELTSAFDFLITTRPLELNKKARKALRNEGLDRLALVRDDIAEVTSWTGNELKLTLQAICNKTGLSMGQIGPPLRAALTGGLPAPDIDQVMAWLGKEETVARIEDQLTANA
ncbi:MAG: glutamate--tRNA ligase [Hyphomonadaceae bacterium]